MPPLLSLAPLSVTQHIPASVCGSGHAELVCRLTVTHTDIRNAADAQVVFEAVRLNILPMIRRRLGPSERDMLRSGEIFVWEETTQKGGLERWTDGRRWYGKETHDFH
jgi:hypothetical protein